MNAQERQATTNPGRRKPTGKAPAWALKLGSALLAIGIVSGMFDYATSHLYIANAPLQPALVAAKTATQATATLSPSVSMTTRTPVTKTASS